MFYNNESKMLDLLEGCSKRLELLEQMVDQLADAVNTLADDRNDLRQEMTDFRIKLSEQNVEYMQTVNKELLHMMDVANQNADINSSNAKEFTARLARHDELQGLKAVFNDKQVFLGYEEDDIEEEYAGEEQN